MTGEIVMIYAAINNNAEIRAKSSSGAVFYELANCIIEQGGVVFAVKLNEQHEAIHDYFESMDDIQPFLGSKYVQSKLNDTYQRVKTFLESGRKVLFCGTPCQVYGLKSFLNKSYDNLILVDFICHGVPSPKVWKMYLEYRKVKPMDIVSFRDKTEGWKLCSIKIGKYRKNQLKDTYMRGFIQNIILRPSCYECRFKGVKRESDITLGDLWGAEKIVPDMFDDKGISVVIIQSEKGKKIWGSIQQCFTVKTVPQEFVEKYNSNIIISAVVKENKRTQFFEEPSIKNLDKLAGSGSIPQKIIRRIKRYMGR